MIYKIFFMLTSQFPVFASETRNTKHIFEITSIV